MAIWFSFLLFANLCYVFHLIDASAGDVDPFYRSCVGTCEKSGCVGEKCFHHCESMSEKKKSIEVSWYLQEPLYVQWKQWDCHSDCQYHCMHQREHQRRKLGHTPLKYHGKWPFLRVYGFQEPVSAALSALNLAVHFHGWVSFFILVYYKLPLKLARKSFYEYTGLWNIYAVLSMNSWFWSAIFHSRDIKVTERLDYSSAVALLGYALIVSILRTFRVRDEAARVMVVAPILAFVTTHILYLNLFKFDYGWNMMVCVGMGVVQLLLWGVWVGVTRHPSRWKLWTVVVGGGFSMLLEIYDFPPYLGMVDAHALWHAATIPLTYIWWSFIRDDAEFGTNTVLKKGN